MDDTRRRALMAVAGTIGFLPAMATARCSIRPGGPEQDDGRLPATPSGQQDRDAQAADPFRQPDNNRATIQRALDDVKASRRGGALPFRSAGYRIDAPLVLRGDLHGGITLDGANARITSTHDGTALELGALREPGPEYRLHASIRNLNLSGPGKARRGSVGIAINDSADVHVHGGIVAGYGYGLKTSGGLICDFYDVTLRSSGYGFHLTETANFAPNSLCFYGLRAIDNTRGGYSRANPNGIINFFNAEIEGNNRGGNDADGVRVTEHAQAGSINYFGSHFESNPGQYNLYYSGSDATKNLLMAGCQVIAGAAEQVHVERGRATLIASRIASSGKRGMVFGADSTATLIDVEGDIGGTLSGILCIRSGLLGFGVNPIKGDPCINLRPANIAAAAGIAANFRGDAVQIRYQRADGTRAGYFQTSAAGDHSLINDNKGGGVAIGGHGAVQLHVGRGGRDSIEPGGDNRIANGSGALRWSVLYAATGAINTSDANAKQRVRDLSAAEHAVAKRCKALIRAFKFNDAVAEKGNGARWHFGVIAQEVDHAFAAEGLDARNYALFCLDRWDDQAEVKDDQGNVLRPFVPAGARHGIRYEELLAFIIAAL